MLFVIGLACVVLGFDPLGQLIGKQGMWWITGAIILAVAVYTFVLEKPKDKK